MHPIYIFSLLFLPIYPFHLHPFIFLPFSASSSSFPSSSTSLSSTLSSSLPLLLIPSLHHAFPRSPFSIFCQMDKSPHSTSLDSLSTILTVIFYLFFLFAFHTCYTCFSYGLSSLFKPFSLLFSSSSSFLFYIPTFYGHFPSFPSFFSFCLIFHLAFPVFVDLLLQFPSYFSPISPPVLFSILLWPFSLLFLVHVLLCFSFFSFCACVAFPRDSLPRLSLEANIGRRHRVSPPLPLSPGRKGEKWRWRETERGRYETYSSCRTNSSGSSLSKGSRRGEGKEGGG